MFTRRIAVSCLALAVTSVATAASSASATTAPPTAQPESAGPVVCDEPDARWHEATPEEAGMDAATLEAAVDDATLDGAFAVRVYRRGCLVHSDRLAAANDDIRFESWSVAKSVTSMVFGRAWTLGLISPDDPLGSLIPEADHAHGAITMRDLLTQTSGLNLNPARDYNIFIPDRVDAALKTEVDHLPGTTFGYSQSGPALLAEAVQRAVGEDFQTFAQRELFGPLGIEPASWYWRRDARGHTQGFFGVNMRPGDFARLGDLLRRGGMWDGERLLSDRYLATALTPNATNGCHGWLIWVNAAAPCNTAMGSVDDRMAPGLPADLYAFNGLFGQHVAVMPTQDVMVVRLGGPGPSALLGDDATVGGGGVDQLYAGVLDSIVDEPVLPPADPPRVEHADGPDNGFDADAIYRALTRPIQILDPLYGWLLTPLPPAGPPRARAAMLDHSDPTVGRRGAVAVGLHCPERWPSQRPARCSGTARLTEASIPHDSTPAVAYDVAAGDTTTLMFVLSQDRRAQLRQQGSLAARVTAVNDDAAGGTPAVLDIVIEVR